MFGSIMNFFKRFGKNEKENSKTTAKERLHLVLAQDRANISADFLDMMKQEIIEVIKKYIDIDEEAIDVRMTNKPGEDGTVGAPALYANIPIVTIKNESRKLEGTVDGRKEINQDEQNTSKNKDENEKTSNEPVENEELKMQESVEVEKENKTEMVEKQRSEEPKQIDAEEKKDSNMLEESNKTSKEETYIENKKM